MTRWGPIQRGLVRHRARPIPDLIERADNRSSLVFGVGIGIALLLLMPLLSLLLGAFAFGALICSLIGHWEWLATIVYGALALILVPFMLAMLADRRLGKHLPEQGRVYRWLSLVLRGYQRIGMGNGFNVPLLIFTTQLGRRGIVLIQIVMFSSILLIIMQRTQHKQGLHFVGLDALPQESATAFGQIVNDHYANRRGEDARPTPYIDDIIANGSYLALYIPYQEARESASRHQRCPEAMVAGDASGDGVRSQRLLDCYAKLHPLTLDGQAIKDVRFDFARDPKTGQRGMLAMLPLAGAIPGRHELTVGGAMDEDGKLRPPDRIPFWR
jgi:hypothetical protein